MTIIFLGLGIIFLDFGILCPGLGIIFLNVYATMKHIIFAKIVKMLLNFTEFSKNVVNFCGEFFSKLFGDFLTLFFWILLTFLEYSRKIDEIKKTKKINKIPGHCKKILEN